MRFVRLKHVVQVSRSGSITAAASSLNTSQSTVTKSVAAMERELGYTLFERTSHGVVMTEKGRGFLTRASRLLSDYEQLVEDGRQEFDSASSLVRAAICPVIVQGLINRAVCRVVQDHPEFRIHLQAVNPENGIGLLRRGDIDLLVCPIELLEGDAGFEVTKIPAVRAGLFVRKGHKLAKAQSITPQEISDYPMIGADVRTLYPEPLRQFFPVYSASDPIRSASDPIRRAHIVEYFPLIAEIVGATDAVGAVSFDYAKSKTFQQKFALLNIDLFEPLAMGCAWRAKWLPSRAVRSLVAALNTSGKLTQPAV